MSDSTVPDLAMYNSSLPIPTQESSHEQLKHDNNASIPTQESSREQLKHDNNTSIPAYKIMVFSWNTESVGLCETMDSTIAEYHRTSYSTYIPGLTTWKYPTDIPDFYPRFAKFIMDNNPDLIVIGFQEDRYPGSYFHSHFLPNEMPKINYGLLKRTKLMGVGVTSYKGAIRGDPFERGIRVSIYAKIPLIPIIEKEEMEMRTAIGNDGQDEYVCSSSLIRGKGATCSYIMLPGFGRLAFICCHLPFNPHSLITERCYKNRMLRQTEVNQSNICFNSIVEHLVLFRDTVPTYVIYFGDFNYRLADPRGASEVADEFNKRRHDIQFIRDMYCTYDELKEQMRRQNIYEFYEGMNNQGPTFLPTCKMVKGRVTGQSRNDNGINYWKTGRYDQRVPSWCDRILYQKFNEDGHKMICTHYSRFDVGTVMSKSDHAGVLSLFELH